MSKRAKGINKVTGVCRVAGMCWHRLTGFRGFGPSQNEPAIRSPRDVQFDQGGSEKFPMLRGPRTLKYYIISGIWALKPYYLGLWTFREYTPIAS